MEASTASGRTRTGTPTCCGSTPTGASTIYISIATSGSGWNERLYHIHDFAEEMEKAGNTVIPLRSHHLGMHLDMVGANHQPFIIRLINQNFQ